MNQLIYGKNDTPNIVSCEINDSWSEIFFEKDGIVSSVAKPNQYWIVSPTPFSREWKKLNGNLYYQYIKLYDNREDFLLDRKKLAKRDIFSIYDEKEASMLIYGFTHFKGMKVEDVSVLSFDIETKGLEHNDKSKVLLISNTFRRNGTTIRKLFSYDEYETEAEFIDDWCNWVREVNPSLVVGHNVFMYDLPYLNFCAKKAGTSLRLGRNDSEIKFNDYDSEFRFDGSQTYSYKRSFIYGREIIDTMFLSMTYDFSRKYASYRLKYIIEVEGLQVQDRQFYDGEKIRHNYTIPEEWVKIKKYAEHDADDALALFDLMIPAYFYYSQSIPKSFQSIVYSATGTQINAFMIRSYIQDWHSLPKTTSSEQFEGAISMGNPGVYRDCFKVDVASLYPSIMIEYKVYDKMKDPKCNFLNMVRYFTEERLNNKKLAKETGNRYYKDLEQAQKIVINSAYGLLGASGLCFNSPYYAAFVTRKGREILQTAIDWATANGFQLVNADTDSISITKGVFITEDERKDILKQINSLYPDKIHFEDDGYYKTILVVKTKNYVLDDGKKIKIKGSALKGSTKEKALKEFMNKVINNLLNSESEKILEDYTSYVKEIYDVKDITRWCVRKTVTSSVLDPKRTNEQKILDAIQGAGYQEGDKIYVYFDIQSNLKLQDAWIHDHDPIRLCEKLYKTLEIFETVLDTKLYPNFKLKRNKVLLEEITGATVQQTA